MIKISEIVRSIIEKDVVALNALQRGIMNFSSYARHIKSDVEHLTKKNVDEKSIVVALSRLVTEKISHTQPDFELLSLSVHSHLSEIAYERTEQSIHMIKKTYNDIPFLQHTYLTVTHGFTETAIIGEKKIIEEFKKKLSALTPVYENDLLVGVAVKFDLKYLSIPNMIAEYTRRLALKNVNIIEIVSTPTELTFIVEKSDLHVILEQLGQNI